MKAKQILQQVLYLNNTEQQGVAVSGLFSTFKEFVVEWFGKDTEIVVGGYENNAEYFYSYNEKLKGIADIILKNDKDFIYLYIME